MSIEALALIWSLLAVLGFVVAGTGLIEGAYLGVAAVIALALLFVAPPWVGLVVAAVLMSAAIPLTRILIRRTRFDGSAAQGDDPQIGRIGVVTQAIENSRTAGTVQIERDLIPARILFDHYGPVAVGTRVLVEGRSDGALEVVTPRVLIDRHARGELSKEQLDRAIAELIP